MAASFPIQSLPASLRQPTTVAMLASLVLHGLIGVSFSSAKPQAIATKPGVKVVELSSIEQGRLPQSVAQAPLPLPTTVPPLQTNPLLPNLRSPNPGIPDSSLYTIPYAPPPPIPWYWTPPLRQAPATNQPRRSPSQTQKPNQPLQPQTSARRFPTFPQSGQQYTLGEGVTLNAPNTPVVTPETSTSRTRPDKIATATVDQLRQLQQQRRDSSGYEGNGTSQSEASSALSEWLEKVESEAAKQNLQNIKLAPSTVPAKLSGAASIAVLVDAQGKLVGDPELIQSSGYKPLNQAALDTVRGHTFQPADTERIYLIRVEFNPQAGAATPSQSTGPS